MPCAHHLVQLPNRSLSTFDIRAKLYAGHISSVYRAVHRRSGITVGLKLYRRASLNDMERHQIAREIWLHIQLDHPSVIALYAAWKDRDYIYLVLEWAPEVCVCVAGVGWGKGERFWGSNKVQLLPGTTHKGARTLAHFDRYLLVLCRARSSYCNNST
jgi:Protein kinase domain